VSQSETKSDLQGGNPKRADSTAGGFNDTERSAELLRLALPLISRHGRGFAPVSYAVWYVYVKGDNPELT